MAGAQRPNQANQDPGQPPVTADALLADLMHTGEILDRHHGQGEELDAACNRIATRRSDLEAEREKAELAIVDDFNARAGHLGMEAEALQDEKGRLEKRQKKHQRTAGRLGNQLRELAGDPAAERPTVIAYAAFVATKPNFTAAAVDSMAELDEAVRSAAGQPFALIQGHNFAFGRIEEETEGLVVNTGKNVHSSDAIKLPVAKTNLAKHGRHKPYFGYFSHDFDHPKDWYETYDVVLSRGVNEEDVINPDSGWSTMSHFNLEEGNLPLVRPDKISVADPDEVPIADAPEEEAEGFWGRENTLFTGPAARAFLHRVVDARLTYLNTELGYSNDSVASTEFGRFMSIAARLGLSIDTREIPIHQDLIRI